MAKKSSSPVRSSDPEGTVEAEGHGRASETGKKGPTPKRKDAQAAHFRPLVPEDRKEARRQAQQKLRAEQQKARDGMARGDDRYLRPNERGPQKRFLRNFIDARITLGEWLLPLMFLVIFATFIPQLQAATWAMLFIWAFLVVAIIEGLVLGQIARNRVKAVVGEAKTEKGFLFQAMGRSMQIRMLRMPKPQVKRFATVEFTGH